MLKVYRDGKFEVMGGTNIGGRMLLGMSSLLSGYKVSFTNSTPFYVVIICYYINMYIFCRSQCILLSQYVFLHFVKKCQYK